MKIFVIQGEELEKFEELIPDIQDAMSQQKINNMESSTEQEVKDSELQNLCILLQVSTIFHV